MPARPRFGALFVLAASVLWGTTGTAATFAPDVSPIAIGAAAMGVGGLLQAAFASRSIARSRRMLAPRWRVGLVGALAVAAYPLAFYSSMRLAGVAVGTVVSLGSAPLVSVVLERVIDKRALSLQWAIGAIVGIAGGVLLCLNHAASPASGNDGAATTLGVLLGLVAGATYALYSWAAHRLMQAEIPSRAAMGAIFGVGGVLLVPVLLATGAPFLQSWGNFAVGAYMAIIPMFLGYVLFGMGLAHVRASTATTLTLAEPAVAAVLAVVVVGERLPPLGWVGIALIVVSLVVLSVQPARPRGSAPLPAADAT